MTLAAEKINTSFDPEVIRRDFPILNRRVHGKPLVYLDNAATTQKPKQVIDAIRNYYEIYNANVHRGLHTLAEESTEAFEKTRARIGRFIGATDSCEIIYTRGTTESINLVAYSWGQHNLQPGDNIVLTEMEHHANLVPWIALSKTTGAELRYIPVDENGYLVLDKIGEIIDGKTRLVTVTQMSNVLGTINPVKKICEIAHDRGALCLVDAAQSAPHMNVDVKDIDADFLAFSTHKMLGPTGLGVLYGKKEILSKMEPFNFGGEMISEVRYDSAKWNDLPWKFEGGTPNIEAAYAFHPAIEYLDQLGMDNIRAHEMDITEYAISRLSELDHIRIFGPMNIEDRGGAVSFTDTDIHPHDLAQVLDQNGVATRAGHHCAQPLHRKFGVGSTTRASFYIYNTKEDVDALIDAIRGARRFFGYE